MASNSSVPFFYCYNCSFNAVNFDSFASTALNMFQIIYLICSTNLDCTGVNPVPCSVLMRVRSSLSYFSPEENDLLAEGLEFYLSMDEDQGSLALIITLNFLLRVCAREGLRSFLALESFCNKLINLDSQALISWGSQSADLSLKLIVRLQYIRYTTYINTPVLQKQYIQNTHNRMSSIRDFVPLMKLGQGSYSSVYKVRRLTDHQIYALKKVKLAQLTTKQKENALNQIRILASIESDYIVGYKEAFFDQKLSVLCIVMEYADGGDLHQIITQRKKKGVYLPEREIWIAAKHILKGLADLHCKNILHRDLKSANIFKSAIKYKLGDLNVSKVNNQGNLAYTQTGTPYYASPQVWRDEPYDSKSDIWSFGCILYEMAALRPPYQGNDMEELYKNVQEKQVSVIPQQYSSDLWQMIQLCLQKKAGFRPTALQLLENAKFSKIFDKYDIAVNENKQADQSVQQKLLQTIKLPSDLKNLKQNLPSSKYSSQVKCKENKSMLQLEGNSNQISTNIPLKNNIPNQIPISNKSEIYQSPSTRMKLDQYSKLLKSPVSQIKLSEHSSQQRVKYSQRLHVSDKKSNKVQNSNIDRSALNVQKYIRQQLSKRPPTSIPRTQKVTSREIKVNIPTYSRQLVGSPRQGLQELRKRLAKKSRVLSGNNPRPSWWN